MRAEMRRERPLRTGFVALHFLGFRPDGDQRRLVM